jgi:ParB-like chromosome segregation protein Spo0J
MIKAWRNRIIATGEESPDQLLANPMNFRRHPQHQQEAMLAALQEVGWVQDVIVNRTTGHLIDGHLRVELALRHNEPMIPVCYVELSTDEERLILATFDPLGALAFTDKRTLEDLMREVSTGSAELQQMLSELAQREGISTYPGDLPGFGEDAKAQKQTTCPACGHQF